MKHESQFYKKKNVGMSKNVDKIYNKNNTYVKIITRAHGKLCIVSQSFYLNSVWKTIFP